jgi:hypothetical protein
MVNFVFIEYNDIRGNNNRRIKICPKKIRKDIVFESCNSWTNRFYHISQSDGDDLR